MPSIAITISNIGQIKRVFSLAPEKMVRELNIAIKKSVIRIQADSMRNTPVKTGRLRASHMSLFENLKGVLQTNTNYDRFIHDGTRYMKARPYMYNAVQSNKDNTSDYFLTSVEKVLAEIAKDTK